MKTKGLTLPHWLEENKNHTMHWYVICSLNVHYQAAIFA